MSEPPKRYEGPGPNSDDFKPDQHIWNFETWWTSDWQFWWDGTQWQPHDAPHVSGLASGLVVPPAKGKVRPPGYWRDFWLGFIGVVAGNILLLIVISGTTPTGESPGTVASLAPWILNLLGLIVFGIVRPRVALGMLSAYGVAFALVVCAGIFLAVLCFGTMPRSGP